MSDTVQLFIVAAGWTIISVLIARLVPTWPGRTALFAVLVGVPFWELPIGYYTFYRLCREQSRLIAYETIAPQSSVCAAYPYVTLHSELIKAGFAVVEVKGKAGEVRKYAADSSGSVHESAQAKLTSSYCMTFVNNNRMPQRILRHDILIVHSNDNRIAAKLSSFYWAGMWWQESASPILGRGGTCSAKTTWAIQVLRSGTG